MFRSSLLAVMMVATFTGPASAQFKSKIRPSSVTAEPVREEKPVAQPATLSPFHLIPGTPFLLARVSVDPSKFSKSSSVRLTAASSSATKTDAGLRNLVFFDLRDDKSTSLFPDNNALILSLETLPDGTNPDRSARKTKPVELLAGQDDSSKPSIIRWHAVEYVTRDTNDDGLISAQDVNALGIADAGGERFVEVIPHLRDVFARQMIDDETLLIIHGSQAEQTAVRIHLPTRRILSAKTLPNCGTR